MGIQIKFTRLARTLRELTYHTASVNCYLSDMPVMKFSSLCLLCTADRLYDGAGVA